MRRKYLLLVCVVTLALFRHDTAIAETQVLDALQARNLGPDALALIENVLANDDIPEPRGLGGASMRYLRAPLASPEITDLLDLPAPTETPAPPLGWTPPDDLPDAVREFIGRIVSGMAAAQGRLNAAVDETCCDRDAMLAEIASTARSAPSFEPLIEALSLEELDIAVAETLRVEQTVLTGLAPAAGESTALREALSVVPGRRFTSPIGTVVIAAAGDDQHAGTAGLVIDLGGDDSYDIATMVSRGPLVIVDLGGNDRYENDAIAVFAVQLRVDLGGDDTYDSPDAGQAAALGGVSIVHDLAGNDTYAARLFGQGAAIGGFAALIDDAGNDQYRIGSRGQGFGGPLGFGGIIDRAGDDEYIAKVGMADPYRRSGGTLSYAQGVGAGYRVDLAGGIGLLRDLAGNDRYDAELFSQGVGYFHGIGVVDDRAGDDAYYGTRNGQGMGAHAGVGLLRDAGGNDGYWLSIGVGQGMGLDVAIGVLDDADGDDRYQSATLAQGASTSNGFGLLRDSGGKDVYALDRPGQGWGRGTPTRGLPALGFLIDQAGDATYMLGGETLTNPATAAFGGPLADRPIDRPEPAALACPAPGEDAYVYSESDPVVQWLARSAPVFDTEQGDGAAYYARMWASLPDSAPRLLRGIPAGDVSLGANLETLLRCYLEQADDTTRGQLQAHLMTAVLDGAPQSELALDKLSDTPPLASDTLSVTRDAMQSKRCATRAGGLSLARSSAGDPASQETLLALARVGMADGCWQAKAAALRLWYAVSGPNAILPDDLTPLLPMIVRTSANAAVQ